MYISIQLAFESIHISFYLMNYFLFPCETNLVIINCFVREEMIAYLHHMLLRDF